MSGASAPAGKWVTEAAERSEQSLADFADIEADYR